MCEEHQLKKALTSLKSQGFGYEGMKGALRDTAQSKGLFLPEGGITQMLKSAFHFKNINSC